MMYTSISTALEQLFQVTPPIDEFERVPLEQCLHRTLGEPISTTHPVPSFDRAAMDGYALRAQDTPGNLRLIGTVSAGDAVYVACGAGQAVRILTGAPIPQGADAVIEQERVLVQNGEVIVDRPISPSRNVSPRGSEFSANITVLRRGTRIGPVEIGLLAALGRDRVVVVRKPHILLITTGSELMLPGEPLGPSQIYDANRFLFTAWLQLAGAEVTVLPIVPDVTGQFIAVLRQALLHQPRFDLVISTGGVSVGDKDDVIHSLSKESQLLFWRLDMHPGKSIAAGVLDTVPILALSGNPGAAMTSWLMLGVPLLAHLQYGRARQEALTGRLCEGFPKKTRETRFLRSRVISTPTGNEFDLHLAQQSDLISSYAQADAFAIIPHDSDPIAPGTLINGLRVSGLGSTALTWDPFD